MLFCALSILNISLFQETIEKEIEFVFYMIPINEIESTSETQDAKSAGFGEAVQTKNAENFPLDRRVRIAEETRRPILSMTVFICASFKKIRLLKLSFRSFRPLLNHLLCRLSLLKVHSVFKRRGCRYDR